MKVPKTRRGMRVIETIHACNVKEKHPILIAKNNEEPCPNKETPR